VCLIHTSVLFSVPSFRSCYHLVEIFALLIYPRSFYCCPSPQHLTLFLTTFHYLCIYLYNIGLGDYYQKHALIVPGPQGETVHHLGTLQLTWPRQMETWGADGLTAMLAPLIWTTRVSSLSLTVVSPTCHMVVECDMNSISCFISKHQEAGGVLSFP